MGWGHDKIEWEHGGDKMRWGWGTMAGNRR